MRKLTSGAIAVLLASAGLAFTAAPASAHTPAASATCEAISISAVYYSTKPASGEPTIANPDYKPAVPGTPAVGEPQITVPNPEHKPAVEATYRTEYLYKQMITGKSKWMDSLTWNPGLGWYYAGETRQTEVTPAQAAVGDPTIVIANPAYVPATPGTPAQGEQTIPNPAYVEADATPNSVTVTVDGQQVYAAEFGESHTATIPLDGTTKHNWIASFVGWNGTGTQTITGKTAACPPVGITVPDLPVTPPTCTADGTLPFLSNPAAQNPNGYEFPGQGFRVYLDKAYTGPGTYVATLQKVGAGFDPAYPYGTKITGGSTSQTLTVLPATGTQDDDPDAPCFTIPENPGPVVTYGEWQTGQFDCGDTTVQITRTMTSTEQVWDGRKYVDGESVTTTQTADRPLTDEELATLECEVPPTEEPEEPTTTPEEPTAPEEPTSEEPTVQTVARAAAPVDTLAQTGSDPAARLWFLIAGAGAVAFGGLGAVLGLRRRQMVTPTE